MRIRPTTRLAPALTLLAALLAAAACSGKINAENYDKIIPGMSQKDVEAILGPGNEAGSTSMAVPAVPTMPGVTMPPGLIGAPGTNVTTKVLTWRNGSRVITVTFVNDREISKAKVGL